MGAAVFVPGDWRAVVAKVASAGSAVARASHRLARRLIVVLPHTRRGMLEQAAACAFGAVDITRGDAIGNAPPVGGRLPPAVHGEEAAGLAADELPRAHARQALVDIGQMAVAASLREKRLDADRQRSERRRRGRLVGG